MKINCGKCWQKMRFKEGSQKGGCAPKDIFYGVFLVKYFQECH